MRAALARLRRWQPRVFGAKLHRFALNPPMPEHEIAAFEARHGMTFPSEYRWFLANLGNGGAGPFYGMGQLKLAAEDDSESPGPLSLPFRPPVIPDDPFVEGEGPHGAIPLYDMGCNYFVWLVVNGPESGYLYEDFRAGDGGFFPMTTRDGERVLFLDHYDRWLDGALREANLFGVLYGLLFRWT